MVDHCLTVLKQKKRREAKTYYIADVLKNVNEILANHYGGHMMTVRLSEILAEEKNEPEKTGDEIALDIIKRAGLKMKGEA